MITPYHSNVERQDIKPGYQTKIAELSVQVKRILSSGSMSFKILFSDFPLSAFLFHGQQKVVICKLHNLDIVRV